MARKSHKPSEDHKNNISLGLKRAYKNGRKPNMSRIGAIASEETRKKISEKLKGVKRPFVSLRQTGENNPSWKGGVTRNKHCTTEYKKWRSDIFARDEWTCKTCGCLGGRLEAHHIKSWSKYPELRFDMNNGITLCVDCHKLTDNHGNKKSL